MVASDKSVERTRAWDNIMPDQADENHRGDVEIIRKKLEDIPGCTDCDF